MFLKQTTKMFYILSMKFVILYRSLSRLNQLFQINILKLITFKYETCIANFRVVKINTSTTYFPQILILCTVYKLRKNTVFTVLPK